MVCGMLTVITSGTCTHFTVFVQDLSTQTQKTIHIDTDTHTHTQSKNVNIVKFETAYSLHGKTKEDH